jgi:hypothetical protein
MAYGFGNTVNPQLGATNYSGYLQGALSGAQMQAQGGAAIAQGLQSAIAGAGAGVKKYLENKETKEMLNSALPNITSSLEKNQFLRESLGITDPTDKNQIRVAIKGFGGGDIRKGLAYVNQLFAQEARAGRESAESKRQAEGFAASFAPVTTVTPSPLAEAAGAGVPFENLPTGVASALQRIDTADPTRAQALKRATDAGVTNPAFLQAILASTSSPQGARLAEAQIGKILADIEAGKQPKAQQPTESVRNAQAAVDAAVAAGLPRDQAPALYAQMLGGPAAVTQATLQEKERDKQADEAKLADEQKKQAEALESTRYRLGVATDTIDKAISLSRLGAGGPLQGLPLVRDISAMVPGFVGIPGVVQGGGRSKTLASYIDTLKGVLTIENLKELKQLSASGASGFGNLSNIEGEKLASSVANLDVSLPENILRENLEVIRGLLTKMRGSSEETQRLSPRAQKYLQ